MAEKAASMTECICHDACVQRTTVFLPEPPHENLRQEAFRRRLSMAETFRLRLALGARRAGQPPRDPLAKVEGAVRHGRLNQDIDGALYWAPAIPGTMKLLRCGAGR
jgi:hypothetical protein